MADGGNINGGSSHGADWEVVALTASIYAASPGSDTIPSDDCADKESVREQESSAMFLSDHFVFPPHEHENLPIEPECSEILDHPETCGILPIEKEKVNLDEYIEDSLESEFSISSVEFQEGSRHGFLHAEMDCGPMVPSNDENDIGDNCNSSNLHDTMPPDFVECGEASAGNKSDGSSLPYEVWWKTYAISLYKKAKETNTFWSICVAAAVMGLVVLGRQWQREKFQLQQLKLQFSTTNERMSRMLGSLARFQVVPFAGHPRTSLIHAATASNV